MMWKRDEGVKPAAVQPPAQPPAATSPIAATGMRTPEIESKRQMERDLVNIGKSVVVKGELSGSEDLTIEGLVEGKIELRDHVLTIGPNAKIKAQVFAKIVVILGSITGNVTATEKVDIRDNGSVEGDVTSPRVAIAEGAHFRGSIDMQRKPEPARPAAPAPAHEVKPASPVVSPAVPAVPGRS
jgi:cytoskeletal protein CcmA (bactofilin family)